MQPSTGHVHANQNGVCEYGQLKKKKIVIKVNVYTTQWLLHVFLERKKIEENAYLIQ